MECRSLVGGNQGSDNSNRECTVVSFSVCVKREALKSSFNKIISTLGQGSNPGGKVRKQL